MSARGPTGVSAGTGGMGFYVMRQFIPGQRIKPERENVIPAESVVSMKTSNTHVPKAF